MIAADIGLHLPDFRAAERTFQLLTQVAGRAGRDDTPGHVVLQTFVPEHYAIEPVVEHDYERFYREELAHRSRLGYPPHGFLAQCVLSAVDESVALQAGEQLAKLAETARDGDSEIEILGPAPAPLARLRGRYRFQVLIKASERAAMLDVARAVREGCQHLPRNVQTSLDVDPLTML